MIGPGDILDAAVARLRAQLGAGVSVEPHEGIFDEAELDRWGASCPGVRVAVTGLGGFTRASSGELVVPVNLAAVCLAKDTQPIGALKVQRYTACQALALSTALALDRCQFGLSGVYPPDGMTARNQFSERAAKNAIAIWQVLWTTRIITGSAVDITIAALSQLYVQEVLFSGQGAAEGVDPLRDGATQYVVTGVGVPPAVAPTPADRRPEDAA